MKQMCTIVHPYDLIVEYFFDLQAIEYANGVERARVSLPDLVAILSKHAHIMPDFLRIFEDGSNHANYKTQQRVYSEAKSNVFVFRKVEIDFLQEKLYQE